MPVEKIYSIVYLPLALSDLQQVVDYIAYELKAPQAAENFITNLDAAISRIEYFPMSAPSYKPDKRLKHDFRILVVENYLVFYTVLEDTVEIHRVIYAKRKIDDLIK